MCTPRRWTCGWNEQTRLGELSGASGWPTLSAWKYHKHLQVRWMWSNLPYMVWMCICLSRRISPRLNRPPPQRGHWTDCPSVSPKKVSWTQPPGERLALIDWFGRGDFKWKSRGELGCRVLLPWKSDNNLTQIFPIWAGPRSVKAEQQVHWRHQEPLAFALCLVKR